MIIVISYRKHVMDKNWKDSLLSVLVSVGKEETVEADSLLFRQGSKPRYFYWLFAGELRLLRHSQDGQLLILHRCRQGPFAEASIFSSRYHCDGVASQASRLLRVELSAFHTLLQDPAFAPAYVRLLSGEVRQLRSRCERLALPRAEDRLLHHLAEHQTIRFGPGIGTLKDLAGELGMTHETLYRTLSTLEKKHRVIRVETPSDSRGFSLRLAD